MSDEEIRKLLADYYGGTISQPGEECIKSYFRTADYDGLPQDLKSSYLLFAGCKSARNLRSSLVVEVRPKRMMPHVYGYAAASIVALFLIAGAVRAVAGTDYGYDFDGSSITSADKALEEMQSLELLTLLKDNEESLNKLFNK